MTVEKFKIEGPAKLNLKKFSDSRGFFVERFKDQYKELLGIKTDFVQDNFSRSIKNVVRGLHMQHSPGQGKLVTCLSGVILDVAVDVRTGSPTFGQHIDTILTGDEPSLFWIPAGFAHGFSVLSDFADVHYKVDCHYNAKNEMALRYDDPELAINWKVQNPVVSDKDKVAPSFADFRKTRIF